MCVCVPPPALCVCVCVCVCVVCVCVLGGGGACMRASQGSAGSKKANVHTGYGSGLCQTDRRGGGLDVPVSRQGSLVVVQVRAGVRVCT
jgi:hypothetical protein